MEFKLRSKIFSKKEWQLWHREKDTRTYQNLQRQVSKMLRERKYFYWHDIIEEVQDTNKEFWNKMKALKKSPKTNALIRTDQGLLFKKEEKAEPAANFFQSQFSNSQESDKVQETR